MRPLVVLAALLALAACSSGYRAEGARFTPLPPPATDEATVYIYVRAATGQQGYAIVVNDEKRGVVGPGGYLGLRVPTGPVEISTEIDIPSWRPALFTRLFSGEEKTTLTAEAGRVYYFRGTPQESPGTETFHLVLEPVDSAVASTEIALTRSAG